MNTNYKISVITPFHNVEMSMFEKCANSMRAQTIGFENVQWIIVVHNCEPKYLPLLQEMFKDDANVEVRELNNEIRTPASPRNHGMQFVTTPYVGFLDGDDSYLPNTLEVALREGIETKSDIVWFRREPEYERPDLDLALAPALWNATRERIVIEHGNWDDAKMFEGSFGFVTNNLFRTEFLRGQELAFSETVCFAEDAYFMVHALARAARICYLPQLIGYHYFINSGSLVQQGNKSAEMLITYAEGFRMLFEAMRGYGIDIQEYIQILSSVESRFILSSPALTLEDRQKIKEILGPYVNVTHLLPPSKTFTAEARRMLYFVSRDVILNPENPGAEFLKFTTNGISVLSSILHHNANTDMGQSYNFAKLELKAYQSRVPITDADFYRPLIDLQTRVGEHNIITSAPIVRYLTKRKGELTPFTEQQAQKYAECLSETLKGHNNILFVMSYPVSGQTFDGAEIDTLNSSIVKDYFSRYYLRGGVPQAKLSSPMEHYFAASEGEEELFRLMVEALCNADAEQIVAFTAKELLQAMQMLERDWQKMVDMMPAGERREEVQRILAQGFDTPVVPQLWPSLKRVVCFGAGKIREAMRQLKRYIGDLPHNHGYDYLKSAVMGKAVADNSDLFECIKDHCFYEFLPADDDNGTTTKVWSELEIGKAYRVVITNHAGLYRYRTNHIICPQEVTPETIRFTIA